jgi:tetratricopeptide (TPR) repeat protein
MTSPNNILTISSESLSAAIASGRIADALHIARTYAPLKNDENAWYTLASLEAEYGDVAKLEAALKKVIALSANTAPNGSDNIVGARYNLGVLLQQQNRAIEAITQYQLVLKHTSHPQAKSNLGLLYLETGDLHQSIKLLSESMREAPDLIEAKLNLSLAFIQAERFNEAEQLLSRVVELQPTSGRAWHSLGLCAEIRKDELAAIAAYSRGIQFQQTFIDSYIRLGRVLAGRGEAERAMAVYEHGLVISPQSYDLHLALGHLLSQLAANGGDYQRAYDIYQKAEAIEPNDARLHYAYGWLNFSEGKVDAAIQRYQQALVIDPQYQEAMAGYATVLERQAKFDEARAVLANALTVDEPHSLVLLVQSLLAKSPTDKQKIVKQLTARVATETNQHWRCDLHFALGKLQDELADYDAAFANFAAGNEIEKRPFDHLANAAFFAHIKNTYTHDTAQLAVSSIDSSMPIFIVGMPRSGTSLVEQILASHPRVYGAGELTAINFLMTHFDLLTGNAAFPSGAATASATILDEISHKHIKHLRALSDEAGMKDVLRVTDKMPHNFICLGLIAQLFPKAKIIHCQRDPLDTCLSIYFQHFNTHHAYANDLTALGQYYRQYDSLMKHWQDVLPSTMPILNIGYEALVTDQATWSRRLIEFVGLDWDEACMQFFNAKRNVNTPSYDQVRKPIYTKSVERWRHYDAHIASLKHALFAEADND